MSKSAERLIILTDLGRGLVTRMYTLMDRTAAKPPTLSHPDLEKVCKLLSKKFPEHPAELEKTPGNDIFRKSSQAIALETKEFYLFFIDLMSWSDAAWALLRDLSVSVATLRLGQATDVMAQYLDLLCLYGKVHLMTKLSADKNLYLSAYARAYHINTGNTETNFLRVATYIEKIADPLKELQEQCSGLGLLVGDTLGSFHQLVAKWSDPAIVVQRNVFSVVEDARSMTDESRNYEDLHDLLYLDRIREWVLWGYLLCPAELGKETAISVLRMCLADTLVLQLARDEMLDVHAEYHSLFDNYKKDKIKLNKHTKMIKELRDEVGNMVRTHASIRVYLRLELERLLAFFVEFPEVIACKIHLVFGLVRLVRQEIVWYYSHLGVAPDRMSRKDGDFVDPHISSLIFSLDRLVSLVDANKANVQAYHCAALQQVDGPQVKQAIEKFFGQGSVSQLIGEQLSQIRDALADPKPGDDFEPLRLNWYRVSVAISSQQSGLVARGADDLNKVMHKLLVRTRCVDRVSRLLTQHASLGVLCWYREPIRATLEACLTAQEGQPAHCVSLVRVLHQGMDQIHRFAPEEQKAVGESAVRTAEMLLELVCRKVLELVGRVAEHYELLFEQTREGRVLQHMTAEQKQVALPPQAGFESLLGNRAVLTDLPASIKVLSEVLGAFRDVETLVVYNTEFAPREFLYEAVSSRFINEAVRCVRETDTQMFPPARILQKLRVQIDAFRHVDRHCGVNFSDVVRLTLQRLFRDPTTGPAGDSVENLAKLADENRDKADDGGSGRLTKWIINFYVEGVLKKNLKDMGVTYSPLRQGFVTYAPQQRWKAEDFMSVPQLAALCRLIGPAGFRAFERVLLGEVVRGASHIKTRLQELKPTLTVMRTRFNDSLAWYEAVSSSDKTRGLAKVVAVGVQIGAVLRFRQLLREGMAEVSREAVPFVFHAVESMHSAKPPGQQSSALTALEVLATDLGITLRNTDQGVRQAVKPLKVSAEDEELWNLLPELFGLSLVTEPWKDSVYMMGTASHNNNVHCLAACVSTLIASFQLVTVDNKAVPEDVEESTRAHLERFARCAASSVLHMSSPARKSQFGSYPLPAIMVFIEQFVTSSGLELSVLEDFLPYSLLRVNYISMYDAQLGGRAGGAEDDATAAPGSAMAGPGAAGPGAA